MNIQAIQNTGYVNAQVNAVRANKVKAQKVPATQNTGNTAVTATYSLRQALSYVKKHYTEIKNSGNGNLINYANKLIAAEAKQINAQYAQKTKNAQNNTNTAQYKNQYVANWAAKWKR